jgi:hypothetical protein
MDGIFPEPRGWALQWEGTALFPAADCVSQDAAAPARWAFQWRRVTEASASRSRSGNGRDGLARPLGWALKWDGAALTGSIDQGEPAFLRAVEREKEGAA